MGCNQNMRKVFVTGGAGYIGSICVEQLLNEGLEVAVFDNLSEGHRAAVDPRAKFYEGDFGNPEQIARALGEFRPRAVMHFAANALVGESMTNPAKYFRNNVGNAVNLLESAVEVGVEKFVFSSTCATYGIPERVPMDESVPQKPINPYGESKLMFEKILGWFSKLHGIKHVNLRYFNAAGATEKYGEDHRIETHLIPNVLKVALGQKEFVEIFGTDYETPDGTCIRDYIHIVDLYQAHRLALDYPESDSFNLGTEKGSSVKEVVEACHRISGKEIPVKESPRRAGDPPRLVASAAKAREKLGWKPKFDNLEAIIGSAWKWHVKNPRGYSQS